MECMRCGNYIEFGELGEHVGSLTDGDGCPPPEIESEVVLEAWRG